MKPDLFSDPKKTYAKRVVEMSVARGLYTATEAPTKVSPVVQSTEALRRAVELRDKGMRYTSICTILNKEGFRPRRAKEFTFTVLASLLWYHDKTRSYGQQPNGRQQVYLPHVDDLITDFRRDFYTWTQIAVILNEWEMPRPERPKGTWTKAAVYSYAISRKLHQPHPKPEHAKEIAEELRTQDVSYCEIARRLNRKGLKTVQGCAWHKTSVYRLINGRRPRLKTKKHK